MNHAYYVFMFTLAGGSCRELWRRYTRMRSCVPISG